AVFGQFLGSNFVSICVRGRQISKRIKLHVHLHRKKRLYHVPTRKMIRDEERYHDLGTYWRGRGTNVDSPLCTGRAAPFACANPTSPKPDLASFVVAFWSISRCKSTSMRYPLGMRRATARLK